MDSERGTELTRPAAQRPKRTPTSEDLLDSIKDDLIDLERAMAGWNVLTGALNTVHGQLRPGERPRGLPIFKYAGSVNGKDVVEVCSDLSHVEIDMLGYVLAPLIRAHGRHMKQTVRSLAGVVSQLEGLVDAALASAQTGPVPQPEEPGPPQSE